jgi:hypothetical protein
VDLAVQLPGVVVDQYHPLHTANIMLSALQVAQHDSALLQEPDLVPCRCQPGTSRAPLAQHLTITQVLLADSEKLPLQIKINGFSKGFPMSFLKC